MFLIRKLGDISECTVFAMNILRDPGTVLYSFGEKVEDLLPNMTRKLACCDSVHLIKSVTCHVQNVAARIVVICFTQNKFISLKYCEHHLTVQRFEMPKPSHTYQGFP